MVRSDTNKFILKNGVRIVTEKIPGVRSVSIGIWIGAGTRHENDQEAGIAHFIEHMMFKGTAKRTAAEIAESLEAVGGQLNAFTTKEFTCYYAKVLDEHLDLAIDVLTDMFFNSTFSQETIDKERGVVEEEIRMYEDTPDELIHDIAVTNVWPNDKLGKSILGSIDSLQTFGRDEILSYIQKNYLPDKCVIAVAGNIVHKNVWDKLKTAFSNWSTNNVAQTFFYPEKRYTVTNLFKKTEQVQICLSAEGLSSGDEKLYPLSVVNNILGGGQSSRLVQSIREDFGLAYSVYSYHTSFADTGLFSVYAGTSPQKYEEVLRLIFKELSKITLNGITEKELTNTKEQIKGSLYLGLESVSSRMMRLGKAELTLNRIITPEEIVNKILAVTLDDAHTLVQSIFGKNQFSLSTIGPLRKKTVLSNYQLTN